MKELWKNDENTLELNKYKVVNQNKGNVDEICVKNIKFIYLKKG